MKKTPYTVLLVLTVVSLALPNPARAQGTDRLPVVPAKSAIFTRLHFSNTYVFEKCAVLPCTALAGC